MVTKTIQPNNNLSKQSYKITNTTSNYSMQSNYCYKTKLFIFEIYLMVQIFNIN